MKAKLRLLLLPLALVGAAIATVGATGGATAASTCTGSACKAPEVKTTPATAITASSATVTASVTPNGQTTDCYFNYGSTTAYGLRTATQTVNVITNAPTQSIAAKLSGLESKTPFHYQVVCANATGETKGADAAFTTGDTGPSQIRLSGHTGFVSGTGTAGVFIGCYGARNCTGSVKILRNGNVIGQRSFYFINSESGGIIHVPLNKGAVQALKALGHYQVTVESTTSDGQQLQGGDAGKTLTLHIFR